MYPAFLFCPSYIFVNIRNFYYASSIGTFTLPLNSNENFNDVSHIHVQVSSAL